MYLLYQWEKINSYEFLNGNETVPLYFNIMPPNNSLMIPPLSQELIDVMVIPPPSPVSEASEALETGSQSINLIYSQSLLSPDGNYAFNFSTTNNLMNNHYYFNICKVNKINGETISTHPIIMPPVYTVKISDSPLTGMAHNLTIIPNMNKLVLRDVKDNTIVSYTVALNQLGMLYITNNGCAYFGNIGLITPVTQKNTIQYVITNKSILSALSTAESIPINDTISSNVIFSPNGLYAFGFQSRKTNGFYRHLFNLYSVSNGIVNYISPISTEITPEPSYKNHSYASKLLFCGTGLNTLCLMDANNQTIISYTSTTSPYSSLVVLNSGSVAFLNDKNNIVSVLTRFSDVLDNGITSKGVNNGTCTLGFLPNIGENGKYGHLALFVNSTKQVFWSYLSQIQNELISHAYFGIFNGQFMMFNPSIPTTNPTQYVTISNTPKNNVASLVVITKYDLNRTIIGAVVQLLDVDNNVLETFP